MAYFVLQPPALFAAATIAVQLGGSTVVVFGRRRAWLGAGALILFTLATIPLAHAFWALSGSAAFVEQAFVQEHLSMVGGLLLAALLGELKYGGPHD